ncbi:MAG: 3-deoxy-D-manno-octulosonic acid transferase [bacterium]|nr:3-deoxy-D-manno-octulosonic acid transferase [bacterium]
MSIYYVIYNALIIIIASLYLPYFYLKSKIFQTKSNILEKLGIFIGKNLSLQSCIWIHAVSVGEVLASYPIIKEVKKEFPKKKIILSVWTNTGFEVALKKVDGIEFLFYFPFDIYWIIKKVLNKINPYLIIILETEIWPNFLHLANKMNIPVILANGRISQKSFVRYKMIPKYFAKEVLNKHSLFCMQSEKEVKSIIYLGARHNKVKICGNSKFDQVYPQYEKEEKKKLLESLYLSTSNKIIVAGSTHKGEEEILLESFNILKKDFPDLRLIIAPRHLNRVERIESILIKKNISYFKYTQRSKKEVDVIILDTIGELIKFYHIATLVIMGGSFVPAGGHNIIEPAFIKKPIIFGPFMENFADIMELFKDKKACIQVGNKVSLVDVISDLLLNKDKRKRLGLNAYKVSTENQGTSKRVIEEIKKLQRI